MFAHYFRLAQRSLVKNRYYTAINIFGLVFGMLSVLVISKYIGGSLHFDSFHVNKDRIYSLGQQEFINGTSHKSTNSTYFGVGELISEFPEIVRMTRYNQNVESLVIAERNSGSVSFNETGIYNVDSTFLKIFTFPLVFGDAKTALSRINSIVLTRSSSLKYFGDINPVGKMLTIRVPWGEETMYEIGGVTEDVPDKSRFKFSFLIHGQPLQPDQFWNVPDYGSYVVLSDNVRNDELAKALSKRVNVVADLRSTNRKVEMSLTSLADVSLTTTEYLLVALGVFITLISWVNYINQLVAQSYWRFKEVGMLRVMGATRKNLTIQFLVESAFVCLACLALIIALYVILEPSLQSFTNGHLLPLLNDPTLINATFLLIFVVGMAITAAVPGVILFTRSFGATLRHVYNAKVGGIGLRKTLVIAQFSISTVLIIGIFVITRQLEYMAIKDKGFDLDGILVVKAPMAKDTTWIAKRKTLQLFMERCAGLPFVIDVTSSTTVPGEEYRQEAYLSIAGNDTKLVVHQNQVNDNFFSLYDVEFIAGHNFTPDARAQNRSSIILNESAANALGISDLKDLKTPMIVDYEEPDVAYNLIGIVRDFHQTSMKYQMKPMAFKFNVARGHISLKISKAASAGIELENTVMILKEMWDEAYPDAAFDYFLLDDKFAAQDAEDQYFGTLFEYFTTLSIIISCLGLFGLSLLISTKRQKEIGVRKVFGASSFSIVGLFLKSYLTPLAISMLIGVPVACLLMNMWLSSYAYRIEIGFWLVAMAVISLTAIFIVTVSYHTVKSSISNPASILRD